MSLVLWLGLLLLAPQGDLERAERAYRLGQFDAALQAYSAALAGERDHRGAVLHNMGNCAMRLGRSAEAAWHYRRALLWLADGAAAAHNLALAEGPRAGAVPPQRPGPGPWLGAAVALQAVGLGLVLAARSRGRRLVGVVATGLGLAAGAATAVRQWAAPLDAVVLRDATLRAAPAADAAATGPLPAGELVVVLERQADWLRVEAAGGDGWVAAPALGVVE